MDKPFEPQRDNPLPAAGSSAILVKPQPTCRAGQGMKGLPADAGGDADGTPPEQRRGAADSAPRG